MKNFTKSAFLMAAVAASASVALAKDKHTVATSDLPASAQQAVSEASRTYGAVKKIEKKTIDGRTVYDVEFEKDNAINPKLRVAADGTVLTARGSTSPIITPDGSVPLPVTGDGIAVYTDSLNLEDVPAAVQATIKRVSAGREIADIDRETWDNHAVYEVEFREKGKNSQVHITEDGSVAKEESNRRSVTQWFKGTQFSDTPAAVQATITREAQGNEIVDIDREGRKDARVYEVEIRGADKKTFELHIAADGSILRDSRRNAALTMK